MRAVMGGPSGQERLEEIVENVRGITADVRLLISANRENVDATLLNTREITAHLRTEIPRLAATLDRVANQIGGTVGENRPDVREVRGRPAEERRLPVERLEVTADRDT